MPEGGGTYEDDSTGKGRSTVNGVTGVLSGDRPIRSNRSDRLGFDATASILANVLRCQTASDGLVIGLEGTWGSGKSSLLSLLQGKLAEENEAHNPSMIDFRPWLIGERDSLLSELFRALIGVMDEHDRRTGDTTGRSVRQAAALADDLRAFASRLTPAGKALKAAGLVVPFIGTIGGFVEGVAEASKKAKPQPSLVDLKKRVNARLSKLRAPVVVVIDDLDRLDPSEIFEVLRLVRSVADFKNIIYLLCYDPEIVSEAISRSVGVKDGRRYLEKIIQVTVPIPSPEAFDLRRWFESELSNVFTELSYQQKRSLASVIDQEGGTYLLTPRSVVRTLDAIRFYWTGLSGQVDPADLVWLQLVRTGNPRLFQWCEKYLVEMAAKDSGRVSIAEEGKLRDFVSLEEHLKSEGRTFDEVGHRLGEFLPGIVWPRKKEGPSLFASTSDKERRDAFAGQRLASSDHFRLYFAFDQPKNAPRSSDLGDFFSALAKAPEQAEGMLRGWGDGFLSNGATKAEAMLNRVEGAPEKISPDTAVGLATVLGNVADELARREINVFLGPEVWRTCTRLLDACLNASGESRDRLIQQVFSSGAALGWLTSVLRKETFAHGRYGDRPSNDRMLSSDELDIISGIMIKRFRGMSWTKFKAVPDQLSTLYGWAQAGDPEGPRELLLDVISSDTGLIEVLEGWSGAGTEPPEGSSLSKSNLSLLPYEKVYERICALSEAEEVSVATRSKRLLALLEHARRF